jgi:HAD superfamily phosphoserine phosphatase-like hydrolase
MILQRVAFFDFCETLVPFQTGDKFLCLLIKEYAPTRHKIIAYILVSRIFRKLLNVFFPGLIIRNMLLPLIKGISEIEIKTVARKYASILQFSINPEMKKILMECKSSGMRVMIVSGGYEEYLRYVFIDELSVEVVGSRFQYLCGRATGVLDGEACLGSQKVRRLLDVLPGTIDREASIVYSDCQSDAPLFNLVDKNKWLVRLSKNESDQLELKLFGGNDEVNFI